MPNPEDDPMPQDDDNDLTNDQKKILIFNAVNTGNLVDLLTVHPFDKFLDIKNDNQETPLEVASKKGYLDIVKYICEQIFEYLKILYGAESPKNVGYESYYEERNKYYTIIKKIIDKGVDQDILQVLSDEKKKNDTFIVNIFIKYLFNQKDISVEDWKFFFKNNGYTDFLNATFPNKITYLAKSASVGNLNYVKAFVESCKEYIQLNNNDNKLLEKYKNMLKNALTIAIKFKRTEIEDYLKSENELLTPKDKEEAEKEATAEKTPNKFGRSRRKSKKSRRKLRSRSKKLRKLRNKFSIKKV